MGFSFVRSRKQVTASRAGNGSAAASSFMPAPPRAGAGAPRGPLPKPKRESGNPPSSDPKTTVRPKIETGHDPYTKNLYSSTEPEKKSPKSFHYGSGFGGADWSNQEPGRKGIDAI
jgi:hypothetical protein